MSFILWVTFVGLYCSAGYHIGRRSVEIARHRKKDDPLTPWLFPFEYANNKLDEPMGLLSILESSRDVDQLEARLTYVLLMSILWPAKLAWNVLPIIYYNHRAITDLMRKALPAWREYRAGRLSKKSGDTPLALPAVPPKALVESTDSPLELEDKRQALLEQRSDIDHAIDQVDARLDMIRAEIETIDSSSSGSKDR